MGKRFAMVLAALAFAVSAAAEDAPGTSAEEVVAHGSDRVALGASVDIDEAVERNVFGAGGRVILNAPVGGKVRLAGGHVEIGPNAVVARDAALAGGDIVIGGTIKGDLKVAGGKVRLDGVVGGDVTAGAGTLELGPNAKIGGRLKYRAEDFERDPAATVAGGITKMRRHYGANWNFEPLGRRTGHWLWRMGLVLLAGLIAGALPGPSRRMADERRARPALTPLLGFVALFCIPIASILVMLTIIGIPFGLLALIGYFALLIVGYVCSMVVVSGLLLEHFKKEVAEDLWWRVGAAAAAMLVLAVVARIPVLGGMIAFVALIVGVGLIAGVAIHRAPKPATPAT
ncbi:MAG: hypothetical protein ACM3X5_02355 [Bacillota bacterium]